jgi:UDP-glucose 4-epimerase
MTIAWVIGGGGLLGSALRRGLLCTGVKLFEAAERFRWDSEPTLAVQMEAAVKAFVSLLSNGESWQIYWAAGVGTMSSTEADLGVETRSLLNLLGFVASEPRLVAASGCFAFASSAGAIYAGATDDIISENTAIAPTTVYAREKLRQEKIVGEFARANCRVTVLLARISTLYGPGQANGKQQGLLAHIARRILRNQPIQIYVPFDTIRDYIAADDAAAAIVAALGTIKGQVGVVVKIIASEQPTTIAEIISIYKRITRRNPKIVISASKLSSIYTRRIQFHSMVIPTSKPILKTSLPVGISQVLAAERSAFARSVR